MVEQGMHSLPTILEGIDSLGVNVIWKYGYIVLGNYFHLLMLFMTFWRLPSNSSQFIHTILSTINKISIISNLTARFKNVQLTK